jgi:hypothetical protein
MKREIIPINFVVKEFSFLPPFLNPLPPSLLRQKLKPDKPEPKKLNFQKNI